MPIKYESLDFKTLLHHQGAYEIIDDNGHHLFSDWNIIAFEKEIFGDYDTRYKNDEQISNLRFGLDRLDNSSPFLRFADKEQHFGYELFLSPPPHWSSRGAPLFWAYAARAFTYDALPMEEAYFSSKYEAICRAFGLCTTGTNEIFVERFAAGGMSSGIVTDRFVQDGLRCLLRRNKLYNGSTKEN